MDYRQDLTPCPECGLVIRECNQPGQEPESDADKLRFLAAYFDAQTAEGLWDRGNREVQEDLIRIALLLETYHKGHVDVMGSATLRLAWQISSDCLGEEMK